MSENRAAAPELVRRLQVSYSVYGTPHWAPGPCRLAHLDTGQPDKAHEGMCFGRSLSFYGETWVWNQRPDESGLILGFTMARPQGFKSVTCH